MSFKFYSITYEALLKDKNAEIKDLFDWITIETPKITKAKESKESDLAAKRSTLWKNMKRGSSFVPQQTNKWQTEGKLTQEEIEMIEYSAYDSMKELGYLPVTSSLSIKDYTVSFILPCIL